ncbi:hypothetical protein BDW59DRAFT_164931 [Aspergillus cavernicola]|uniref:Uncharacterized protein n=1 Tax=Aspergillus cavernicola TaxID=176166 RepID=A0ABR4HVT3_9EURO
MSGTYSDVISPRPSARQQEGGLLPANENEQAVVTAYKYLAAISSKKVCQTFIERMNVWLKVPEPALGIVKSLITIRHKPRLVVADIDDNGKLRRGKSTAHVLYRTA